MKAVVLFIDAMVSCACACACAWCMVPEDCWFTHSANVGGPLLQPSITVWHSQHESSPYVETSHLGDSGLGNLNLVLMSLHVLSTAKGVVEGMRD